MPFLLRLNITALFACFILNSFAQDRTVDSLKTLLRHAEADSAKCRFLLGLSSYYTDISPDSSDHYAGLALQISGKDKALQRFSARSFKLQGINASNRGEYQQSMDFYLKSTKINEDLKNERAMADDYTNLGILFMNMGSYARALEYDNKALAYYIKSKDKQGIADLYNNIGITYCSKNSLDTCLIYQLKSIAIKEELNDKRGLATSYDNVGQIYMYKKKLDNAIEYYLRAEKIKEGLNDKMAVCITYLNLAQIYTLQKNYAKALEYGQKELKLAEELNSKTSRYNGYLYLSNVYLGMRDFKNAFLHFKMYSLLKDSVLNEENTRAMHEVEAAYDSEKKDNKIRLLNKENQLQEADLKKQQVLNWSIGAGLLVMIVSSFVVYRSYRQKKRANVLLEEKNKAIYEQNHEISEKKKEIEDSINYARYIQQSILPDVSLFKECFGEHLLLYLPKDIVSGDFYFLQPSHNGSNICLAAVDCTGHGVPGGFMSVVGAEVFTSAAGKENASPAKFLSLANKRIKHFLRQGQNSTSKDGMDAALCMISPDKKTIVYSGANRPLVLIRNGELKEYEATKSSLGGVTDDNQQFTKHTIDLQKNDCIYIFSDGYADQFGGEKGKKMMTKNFKKMLVKIHQLSMEDQQRALHNHLLSWRGSLEQVDDILVIGFRV